MSLESDSEQIHLHGDRHSVPPKLHFRRASAQVFSINQLCSQGSFMIDLTKNLLIE